MYNLTVTSGSGTGQYAASTPATITADAPKEGYRFSGWTIASGTGTFADQKAATTTFTCSSDASVQANYEPIPYKITVKNGKPSGTYTIGQKVSLQADYPAAGKEFDNFRQIILLQERNLTSGRLRAVRSSLETSPPTIQLRRSRQAMLRLRPCIRTDRIRQTTPSPDSRMIWSTSRAVR